MAKSPAVPDEIVKAIKAIKLNQHRVFATAFIRSILAGKPNGAQAYREAGYSATKPSVIAAAACVLLKRDDISKVIDMAREFAGRPTSEALAGVIGDLAWKRQQLIEITGEGRAKKVDAQGNTVPIDLGTARASVVDLAKIDGDFAAIKVEVGSHESFLDQLE